MEKSELHAFIYSDPAGVVQVRLSDGRTASFTEPRAWLTAMSWAVERVETIEIRT